MSLILVLVIGIVAGTVGGIVGFGASIMLMPALVLAFGPHEAVPIMAVGSVMANASRVAVWWHELDWRAAAAYAVGAVPGAALGAFTLLQMRASLIEALLGGFFVGMIALRRWMKRRDWHIQRGHMALVGLGVGFLTGLVVSTGPINTPFFLAYGLTRGAFLGTEALASVSLYLTKALTFGSLGALPLDLLAKGAIIGASLIAGSLLSKRLVLRMQPERFEAWMDALLLVSGLLMISSALGLHFSQ